MSLEDKKETQSLCSRITGTLSGRCPACCKASIFDGVLGVKERCPSCGFHLSEHDAGDGPVYIGICIVGTLVVLLAVWLELAYQPPLWVHAVLWIPFTFLGTIGILRVAKSWLIHAQYTHNVHHFKDEHD